MTTGRLLVRNTVLNTVAQVAPALVAIVTVPMLLSALGQERFGILTIAWAAIGYFSLFDLGLSRALTQAVSKSLGTPEERRLGELSMSALVMMGAMGLVGGLLLAAMTPWLLTRGLKVPANLQEETRRAFFLLSASLPFVVVTAGLRGILEAHQHFGLATALRIPYATIMFLGPIAVLPWTRSIDAVVATLVIGRVLLCAAHIIVCRREYPFLRGARPRGPRMVASLLRTGGWMTVSNIISPLMVNLDRLLVGGLLSLAAVSYYATAFEISIKLLLIPGALLAVFFPAFAAAHTSAPSRAGELYDGMLRSMLLLMFPGTLVFVAFAPEILTHWVGRDVAMNAATVMQILCIGVFINSMGQVSFSALQALGRPDLTAKLHVVELPLYAIAVVLLTREYGLTGVAIAWTARVAADTVLLAWLMRRRVMDGSAITRRGFAYLGILGASVALAALPSSSTMRALVVLTILVVSIPVAWRQGLRQRERELVGSLLGALKWNTQSP